MPKQRGIKPLPTRRDALAEARALVRGAASLEYCKDLVFVIHDDGSVLLFRWASLFRWRGWWLVLTEHHGVHAFVEDDTLVARQLPANPSKRWPRIVSEMNEAFHNALSPRRRRMPSRPEFMQQLANAMRRADDRLARDEAFEARRVAARAGSRRSEVGP